MATFEEQSDLVVDRVRDLATLAEQAVVDANRYLQDLATAPTWTSANAVDINIGTNVSVNWPTTISAPTTPVEPEYEADAPTAPTITAVIRPAGITVNAAPDWDVDLSGAPSDMPALNLSALPTLDTLPEITAVAPIIDVDALDTDFVFNEPVYTERVSSEIQVELERVLGGDLGIPQAVWDAMWAEVSSSIARQQVGRLRLARNRGAASYWALPNETVLAESNRIADEGYMEAQKLRFEQLQRQAVFANDDFWKAISQGIAYENQWITAHQQLAARALGAAEQLYGIRIQVHNANVQRFNQIVAAAKISSEVDQAKVARILDKQRVELETSKIELAQDSQVIQRYQAAYQGYDTSKRLVIQDLAEQIRRFSATVDADTRYTNLTISKEKLDVDVYTQQFGQVESIARATAAVLNARTDVARFDLEKQVQVFKTDESRNQIALGIGRITQAAQEAAARLDIAQSQWAQAQANDTKKVLTELAYQFAQAAVSASQVSLASRVGIDESESITASRNAPKVW